MKTDIGNRVLLKILMAAITLIVLHALALPRLGPAWQQQGSAVLYLFGASGAALLLVSVLFLIAKRSALGSPRHWFIAHIVCASLGTVLVFVHAAGSYWSEPALLLLCLIMLMALGTWARFALANNMANTFATKRKGFAAADDNLRAQLQGIISAKQALLLILDAQASEALFSVTLAHWLRQPRLAMAYQRLVHQEQQLIGTRQSVGGGQAWWRPLHMALAVLFVLGLCTHVLVVTFFAGYVAEGRDIYWWHLTQW